MECQSHDLIRVPDLGISKSGKFLLKLGDHHSGTLGNKPIIRCHHTTDVGSDWPFTVRLFYYIIHIYVHM